MGWLVRSWAKIILKTSFIKFKVVGKENIKPDKHYFFAANHESEFDIPLVFAGINLQMVAVSKIELKNGEQTISANINGFSTSWITFDTTKINPKKSYDIITSTSQIELGGLRLDNKSNLYWPWDQGVILSYHRNIPYQFK